jgi:ADP-ribose pyrophosphatase YjhB (NUDIX family)
MPLIKPVPAVNGIIINEKREVLLTRRSPIVREPGKWCIPGGHLDGGEDWRNAVRRELNEEVGITVTEEKLVGVYSDPSLTVTAEVLKDGFHAQFVVASFLITRYEGTIKVNEEVDLWGWFSFDALPTPILKSHPIRIRDALDFTGEAFVR